jgi:DNA-directed RNA polymerase subunit alpha
MNKSEYKPLTIPKITWDKKTLTETFGTVVAQPLEPGFGITLGNALRRTLLGGIEGSAVTSVIIQGVNNEFTTIPGVIEDIMQLILNIKQIVIKNSENRPGTMKISAAGKSTITVADIVADEHLQFINPDHVLAHLSDEGSLEIEFFVESGRGYQKAQWPEKKSLQKDNRIYLDAMFSPLRNVSFHVEKTRVGKEIDYDSLSLEITTNGAETPVAVLNYATSVLRSQLENFLVGEEILFNEFSQIKEEAVGVEIVEVVDFGLPEDMELDFLLKSIDELELSARAHNCLLNAKINRVIDLINVSEDASLRIKNFGRKSLDEVRESLSSLGLRFGMDIKEEAVIKVLEKKSNS